VKGIGGIASAAVVAPRRAPRMGGGFTLPDSPSAEAAGAASATGSVAALLAMQEDTGGQRQPEDPPARRAAMALDELRDLQLDLLRGAADPARLERLAALASSGTIHADPALKPLLAEILLRARVELARRRAATARPMR
jgi:hypothetical protein